jgi:uncharacterized protein (TIGR00251 family)
MRFGGRPQQTGRGAVLIVRGELRGELTQVTSRASRPGTPPVLLPVRDHADGVSFDVVVVPRASRSKVVGLHGTALKVTLAAAPVDGEANAELCALLAKALSVPKRSVRIVRGEHSKTKTVQVDGVDAARVRGLLAEPNRP